MYYLQSRYYDPAIGRFINADSYASTGQGFLGCNMFAYCENNPVNSCDPTGHIRTANAMMYDGGGGANNAPFYDRTAAVSYANKWYNSFNPDYYRYKTDCANFVSQCLNAGGINQTTSWHMNKGEKTYWYNPLGWISSNYRYSWDVGLAWSKAADQYQYFSRDPRNSTVFIGPSNSISSVVSSNNIQAGDLLYFVEDGTIHHATIISCVDNSMIYFAGHTRSRFNEPLSGHISSDGVYIVIIGY